MLHYWVSTYPGGGGRDPTWSTGAVGQQLTTAGRAENSTDVTQLSTKESLAELQADCLFGNDNQMDFYHSMVLRSGKEDII